MPRRGVDDAASEAYVHGIDAAISDQLAGKAPVRPQSKVTLKFGITTAKIALPTSMAGWTGHTNVGHDHAWSIHDLAHHSYTQHPTALTEVLQASHEEHHQRRPVLRAIYRRSSNGTPRLVRRQRRKRRAGILPSHPR